MPDIAELANSPGRVRLLWDVAQIPDFRNMMTLIEGRERLLTY